MEKREECIMISRPTDPRILEALCVHELYRKLGFSSEQIHLTVAREADEMCEDHGHLCLYVSILLKQNAEISETSFTKDEFHVRVDRYAGKEAELAALWTAAAAWFNTAGDEELTSLFEVSRARRWMALIVERLGARGIPVKFSGDKPS